MQGRNKYSFFTMSGTWSRNRVLGYIEDSQLHRILKSALDVLKFCHFATLDWRLRGSRGGSLMLSQGEGQTEQSERLQLQDWLSVVRKGRFFDLECQLVLSEFRLISVSKKWVVHWSLGLFLHYWLCLDSGQYFYLPRPVRNRAFFEPCLNKSKIHTSFLFSSKVQRVTWQKKRLH